MTRDEILEAAAQIFSQKGFHAASMQDIAEAVNLQKASLYYHVTSKQEILLSLLNRALDMLILQIEQVVRQPLQPEEKLRQAMIVYLQAMLDHRELAAVLLLEHRSLEPQYQSRHFPHRDRFERLWRDLIQEGVDKGVFESADPGLASKSLLGVLNWTITWFSPQGKSSAAQIGDQFAGLFLRGLLKREES